MIKVEDLDFQELYNIEKDKILRYYERLGSRFNNLSQIQLVARFLVNQSIGSNYNDVYNILIYFKDKIEEGKDVLDLAFEWIRAQKIRLEYKKYLSRAQYPFNNLSLAVDDCIFKFFLEYDNYIRSLLKNTIREYNFSALYEIFFSPYDSKNLNIKDILDSKKDLKEILRLINPHFKEERWGTILDEELNRIGEVLDSDADFEFEV